MFHFNCVMLRHVNSENSESCQETILANGATLSKRKPLRHSSDGSFDATLGSPSRSQDMDVLGEVPNRKE